MDRSPGKEKLEARSRKKILVGYSSSSKAYRISLPEEKRIETSRDVSFTDEVPIQSINKWEDFIPQEISPQEMLISSDDVEECEEPHVIVNLLDNQDSHTEVEENDEEEDCGNKEVIHKDRVPDNAPRRDPGRPRVKRTGRPTDLAKSKLDQVTPRKKMTSPS